MPVEPIYTLDNTTSAYQLRWSLALFSKQPIPPSDLWLEKLKTATERDHVRILEFRALENNTLLFLISTKPSVKPPEIVKSIKGRLQHALRPTFYAQFRRNFRLTSVGESNLSTVENYVARQLDHHPLASPISQQGISELQLDFKGVDLSEPINSAHGQYVTALHVVMVHAERWRTAEPRFLSVTRDAIVNVAPKKGHRVSRLALLPDHVHFTLGFDYASSPAEVAVSYLNNIAYRHGMLRLWMNSFYVGTIGPYDMGAVRPG